MLEGKAQAQAERMRDELASLLKEKGIDAVPDKDLTGAWLVKAILARAQLEKANLYEAQLKEANLVRAQLQEANLVQAQLEKANLVEAQLKEAYLARAQLEKANLVEAQLKEANLEGAQLKEANLVRAQLKEANLYEAQLKEADLRGAQLEKANLVEAQLKEVKLYGAQLEKANLYEAQLKEAYLEGAQLKEANLAGAQLEKADLENAQLQEADLTGAKLRCANFTGTNLTKAKLDEGALKTMTNYRPPRPPTVRAKGAWRVKAVAFSASSALYQQFAQDDGDDDDDDEDDGSASADDDDEPVASQTPPWEQQANEIVEQAVEALFVVAQPVLALVEPAITELESLCVALAQEIPPSLVLLVPQDTSSEELKPVMHTLLKKCMLELLFDQALPGMVKAIQQQLQTVMTRAEDPPAEPLTVREAEHELLKELRSLSAKIIEEQKLRVEKMQSSQNASPGPGAAKGRPPQAQEQLKTNPSPATAADPALTEAASAAGEQLETPMQPPKEHLCTKMLRAVSNELIDIANPEQISARLKQPAAARINTFVTEAAGPIAVVLSELHAGSDEHSAREAAARLPSLMGVLTTLKDELCREALRKRISEHLLGCLPTQSLGHSAAQKLAVAGRVEAQLCARLEKLGDDNAKLLRRHLPLNGIRGRAFEAVLKTATKYKVRVGGFEGSVDMALMAWRRGRVALTTDENELQYLLDELAKLKEKESTASNWRDAAEGWISVLELRGKLRVECGQAVLECVCSDEKVLEALGASKVLMQTDGEAPAGLVRYIAQGPGAHIRKHGYGYTKRLNKEIAIIRRVKELQVRAVAGLGTLLVATAVAVGNYFSRVMYDGVTNGFATQSWLTWVLPVAAVAALIVVGLVGVAAYLCRKGIFRKTLRGCCSACRCGCSFGAKKARVSPGTG